MSQSSGFGEISDQRPVALVATIACGGLGVPGGLIGPLLVIGAGAGGALGIIGHALVPGSSAAPAFYATLGAVAMMGAALHAPLAALTAVLELTGNPNIILPGMAAVITAFLVSRAFFGQKPLFVAILHARGIDYRVDAVALELERTGVAAVMSPDPAVIDERTMCGKVPAKLSSAKWAVLVAGDRVRSVWPVEALGAIAAKAEGDTAISVAAGADVALVVAGAVARAPYVRGVISRVQTDAGVRRHALR